MNKINSSRTAYGVIRGLLVVALLGLGISLGSRATAQQPLEGVIGRAIKALTGKKDEKAAGEEAEPVIRKAPPVDPDVITFTLSDGSTIAGKLDVTEIQLTTSYGMLTIPVSKILSFTPGLDSRRSLDENIKRLIEQIGSEQFNERELAKRELTDMGVAVQDELRKALAQEKNDSRIKVIKVILEKIEEEALEADEDSRPAKVGLLRNDTVATAKFTATGKISPKEFKIQSKFGQLIVKLADIQKATRPVQQALEITKTVTVGGQYIIQKSQLSTKISVKRGDRITIRAEGQLTMSPWGSNNRSTPDGDGNQYGWYVPGIPGGALVAKIGTSGQPFKVGSKQTFTAKRSGVLYLAIGMNSSQASSTFPGGYKAKIQLKRD